MKKKIKEAGEKIQDEKDKIPGKILAVVEITWAAIEGDKDPTTYILAGMGALGELVSVIKQVNKFSKVADDLARVSNNLRKIRFADESKLMAEIRRIRSTAKSCKV
jgi:hypothetical protein